MRNAIIVFVLICLLILTGVTVYSIEGKTTRQNELDANLSSALERSMEIVTIDPSYTISRENDEHLIADFIMNFLLRMNSDSDFQIEVLGVDVNKGLLSVRVTETFPSLFFKGTVTSTKTIILEDYTNLEDKYFKVTFYNDYVDGEYINSIKQVNIYGGSALSGFKPAEPVKDGYTFKGWQLALQNEASGEFDLFDTIYTELDGLYVTRDVNFVAVWEKDHGDVYTVTFYSDNQLYDMKKIEKNNCVDTIVDPVKEGYTFTGWLSSQGEFLSSYEVENKSVDNHLKFTAVFQINE